MKLNNYIKKRFYHLILIGFIFSSMLNCGYREKNNEGKNVEIITTNNFIDSSLELTDYGEPIPIDVVKECIYYSGGKEPQKNVSLNDLYGEWEFERDIKVTLKLNPNMTYTETREGYLMDEDNNSKPYKKVKSGKFTFKDNVLTLLDYNSKEELHPTDWKKYKNPLNNELVVFSLNGDTLSLYESGVGNYTYLRSHK